MEAGRRPGMGTRQRPGASQITKLQHSDSSESHATHRSNSSASWSPLSDTTPPSSPQYHLRQVTVASPASTSTHIIGSGSQQKGKGKQTVAGNKTPPPNAIAPLLHASPSPLGPSMLSSSSYKSINLNSQFSDGDSDEPARIITYTKHSQGFTWNDELFLPSYLVNRHRYGGAYRGGSRRYRAFDDDEMGNQDDETADFDEHSDKCPVTDIFVTDEEAAAMMP